MEINKTKNIINYIGIKIDFETLVSIYFTAYNTKNNILSLKILFVSYNKGVKNYSIVFFDYFPVEIVEHIIQLFINNRIYNDYLYKEQIIYFINY